MISKLTSLNPGWEVGLYGEYLNDPDAQDRSDKSQWKLEHDWDNPLFDEPMSDKLFSPLVDAVVTGTGVAKLPWCYVERTRYEKNQKDEVGNIDLTKQEKITQGIGYNELIPHDIMSTYVSPAAKNPYAAEWIILEDWVTYSQMVKENEAAGGNLYDKDALAKVKDMKSETDRFARQKQSRDMINNGEDPVTEDETVAQFKRLECYEKSTNYIYTLAVGKGGDGEETFVQLKTRRNPYWHGHYPLVFFYTKKRPHSIWGQGIFEDTERLQSAFNDLFNHYMDNLNLSLDGMIMKQEGEEYNYIVEPGGEFLYQNKEPQQFKFPEPNAAQFNTVMQFIETQIESSTVSDYLAGTPQSPTDKTAGTATGIMRLQEAAGDKLASMKAQFSNSLREVGRQWMSNNQQFLDRPITVMGTQEGRPGPVTVNPEDIQGDLMLRVNDASMEPQSKDQILQQFEDYLAQLNQLQQQSIQQAQLTKWTTSPVYIDYTSLIQDLSQKMGQNNIDKILLDQKDVENAMMQSRSPFILPHERFTFDINELYGSEAAQFLERNGVQPDPQRQAQVPTAATTSADNPNNGDPNQLAIEAGKQGLEQQKLDLQAQDQYHKQGIDQANLLLQAHQTAGQLMNNNGVNNGPTQTPSAGSSGGAERKVREPQPTP